MGDEVKRRTADDASELEQVVEEVEKLNDAGGAAAARREEAVRRLRECAARVACLQMPPPTQRTAVSATSFARAAAAHVWWLRGRIAAALAERGSAAQAEAEADLSRAVRLCPRMSAAWTLLGELCCRRTPPDLTTAKLCMCTAVDSADRADPPRRAAALRGLSMVLRQIAAVYRSGCAPLELAALEDEGLRCAREAVALGVADGSSWFVLGNAFVSKALSAGSSVDELRSTALKAYEKAEQCGFSSPDLHFNKAAALAYCFDNDRACEENWKAHELDPGWDAPLRECSRIAQLNEKIAALLARKRARSAAKLVSPAVALEQRTELLLDVVGIATGLDEAPLTMVVDDGGGRAVLCLFGVAHNALHPGDIIELSSGFAVERQAVVSWRRPFLSFSLVRATHKQVVSINGTKLSATSFAAPVATMSQETTVQQ